jgi:hypothetical protein
VRLVPKKGPFFSIAPTRDTARITFVSASSLSAASTTAFSGHLYDENDFQLLKKGQIEQSVFHV